MTSDARCREQATLTNNTITLDESERIKFKPVSHKTRAVGRNSFIALPNPGNERANTWLSPIRRTGRRSLSAS